MALFKTPKLFDRSQSGDTIVEVVIAIAVIAVIMVGAFAVTNRSETAVRDSEEHSEALQDLQGQVEYLRSAASQAGFFPANFAFSTAFCLSGSTYYQPASSSSSCLANAGGSASNPLYRLSIVLAPAQTAPHPPDTTTSLFDLTATWPALNGGTDTVQLAYQVQIL